jgi:hypothetical protein
MGDGVARRVECGLAFVITGSRGTGPRRSPSERIENAIADQVKRDAWQAHCLRCCPTSGVRIRTSLLAGVVEPTCTEKADGHRGEYPNAGRSCQDID